MKESYRDQRGFLLLNALAQDVRYALRGMRRAPGFTIVAVLTLAIAIGANTAMFSLADALVLKPFPVDRPDQLRALFSVIRVGGRDLKSGAAVNYRVFADLRAQAEVFSGLMAFGELDELPLDIDGREIRANGAAFVSDNYFRVLGVTPSRGRDLAAGEDLPGSGRHLLLLADRFWRRAFDADPGAVGKTLRIGGEVFTVIGITLPDFFGVVLGRAPDVFLPPWPFWRLVCSGS